MVETAMASAATSPVGIALVKGTGCDEGGVRIHGRI